MTRLIVVRFTCHLLFHVATRNPAIGRHANVDNSQQRGNYTPEKTWLACLAGKTITYRDECVRSQGRRPPAPPGASFVFNFMTMTAQRKCRHFGKTMQVIHNGECNSLVHRIIVPWYIIFMLAEDTMQCEVLKLVLKIRNARVD